MLGAGPVAWWWGWACCLVVVGMLLGVGVAAPKPHASRRAPSPPQSWNLHEDTGSSSTGQCMVACIGVARGEKVV